MTPIVTALQMRELEAATIAAGSTEADLMRRAAEQIAQWIETRITRERQRRALAFVGPGNNGGDALVALALLRERGWACECIMFGRDTVGVLPADRESLAAITRADTARISHADVILDGVFGIGGRTDLPESVATAFRLAREARQLHRIPMIAIDVPSGTDATTGNASLDSFRADVTLCLGFVKRGLLIEPAASHAGDIEHLNIGLTEPPVGWSDQVITIDDIQRCLPQRRASTHKSDAGTALIISGAPTYYGAPRLAAEAALRAGAGLVALATPESVVPTIAGQLPEVVHIGLPDEADALSERVLSFIGSRASTLQSIVVGPGIGRGKMADSIMTLLFSDEYASRSWFDHPAPGLVIDADALNWLSERDEWYERIPPRSAVLTPHAGEMARLMRTGREVVRESSLALASEAAVRWQQHVVLKSGVTALATPDGHLRVSPRATPELATAGTGDVLAGLIGGLMAQGLDAERASMCALWVGATAGKRARDNGSTLSVIARDVIDQIPRVMNAVIEPNWTT